MLPQQISHLTCVKLNLVSQLKLFHLTTKQAVSSETHTATSACYTHS